MGVLLRESVKKPEKLEDQRHREYDEERKRLAIEDVVASRLNANIPIVRAQQIQAKVLKDAELEVDLRTVRKVMRKDL